MVDFRGHNLSLTLGQSTQLCDKTDYTATPPFWSADSVSLLLGKGVTSYKLQPNTVAFLSVIFSLLYVMNKQEVGVHWIYNVDIHLKMSCFSGLFGHTALLFTIIIWGTSSSSVISTVQKSKFAEKWHQSVYQVVNMKGGFMRGVEWLKIDIWIFDTAVLGWCKNLKTRGWSNI